MNQDRAAATSSVRIGVLMAAVPRRHVGKLARETAYLDVLSGGRLVVGAGLGSMPAEYARFGQPAGRAERAGVGPFDVRAGGSSGQPASPRRAMQG